MCENDISTVIPEYYSCVTPLVIFQKYLNHSWQGGSYPPFLGHPPPLSKIPPFLEIQDVPTFYRPNRKMKVLNESFNQLLYKFYQKSFFWKNIY